jgi:hypothetical protein
MMLVLSSSYAKSDIDRSVINKIFKQSVIVDEAKIHFDERLISLPIKLSICVGQDRRMSRVVKMLGCQDVKTEEFLYGKVILDGFNFSQANPTRNLVYFFNWKTLDPAAPNFQESSVFVVNVR